MNTLFGLVAATGMRVGKALALTRRNSSSSRTCSPSDTRSSSECGWCTCTRAARTHCTLTRDHFSCDPRTDRFFHIDRVVERWDAERVFRHVTTRLGLRTDTVRPRIHDLRRTFAVRGARADATGRGTSMTSKTVAALLTDLGVVRSHSRPRVNNDNPFSGAWFKTLKYAPVFPDRFGSLQHARSLLDEFVQHYNHEHRHSGIGLHTPDDVHYGLAGPPPND